MVNDDERFEPKIGDNKPKLSIKETKEKKDNNITSLLTGVALGIAVALGTYNAYVARSLSEESEKMVLSLENMNQRAVEMNSKLKGLENELSKKDSLLIGSNLGYSVQLDLNSDSNLDKITPLSSGNSIVELATGKNYSQKYHRTYSYMEDIISDYILGTSKKIPFEHVKKLYSENPAILCDAKKIAKSLGIWPESGVMSSTYENNYNQLDKELGQVNCNPK